MRIYFNQQSTNDCTTMLGILYATFLKHILNLKKKTKGQNTVSVGS
jgi:hypothetical protein